jgi:hypothetical protein
VSGAAALTGMPYTLAESPAALGEALSSPGLIEVRTEPGANVALHRQVFDDVAAQLG